MREPRRDHYIAPATGADTEQVIEDAIDTLGTLRRMPSLDDAGATLHLLTSLIAQAEQRLSRAVADARDQNYSWAQIADLLGVTRASAWQRYRRHTTSPPHTPQPDSTTPAGTALKRGQNT
jgi:hypothetical protein